MSGAICSERKWMCATCTAMFVIHSDMNDNFVYGISIRCFVLVYGERAETANVERKKERKRGGGEGIKKKKTITNRNRVEWNTHWAAGKSRTVIPYHVYFRQHTAFKPECHRTRAYKLEWINLSNVCLFWSLCCTQPVPAMILYAFSYPNHSGCTHAPSWNPNIAMTNGGMLRR